MFLHVRHQAGAQDVAFAGPVFDVGRDHELTARLHALDQERFEHRAARIDGGGVASRTRSDDQDFRVSRFAQGKCLHGRMLNRHGPESRSPKARFAPKPRRRGQTCARPVVARAQKRHPADECTSSSRRVRAGCYPAWHGTRPRYRSPAPMSACQAQALAPCRNSCRCARQVRSQSCPKPRHNASACGPDACSTPFPAPTIVCVAR